MARNAARGERIVDRRYRKTPVEGPPKPCCTVRQVITSIQGVGQSHGGSAIRRLGVTEEGPTDRKDSRRTESPGRGDASQRRRAVGCQPVRSSRVPAGERTVAVRCKRKEPGGGRRKDREQASRSRQTGHSKGFWDDDETEWARDVTNRGFPQERYKPRKPSPTSTESPAP